MSLSQMPSVKTFDVETEYMPLSFMSALQFASCSTYNICSVIRGFLHITSLLQVTWWTCSTNSKGLVTFAWHFFELTFTKGWAVEQKFYPPAKIKKNGLWYLLKTCVSAGNLLLQQGITSDNAQNFDQTLILCWITFTPMVLCSSSGWDTSASVSAAWLWQITE